MNQQLFSFKVVIFLTTIMLLISGSTFAQEPENEKQKGRFFLTPELGLLFGTITRIETGLGVGYHITNRQIAGVSFRYEYYMDSRKYNGVKSFKTHIFGGKIFWRYTIIENVSELVPVNINLRIFSHLEYEALSLERKYFYSGSSSQKSGRFINQGFLAGGGISQQVSQNLSVNILALWDISGSDTSPYVSPVLKFGINFFL